MKGTQILSATASLAIGGCAVALCLGTGCSDRDATFVDAPTAEFRANTPEAAELQIQVWEAYAAEGATRLLARTAAGGIAADLLLRAPELAGGSLEVEFSQPEPGVLRLAPDGHTEGEESSPQLRQLLNALYVDLSQPEELQAKPLAMESELGTARQALRFLSGTFAIGRNLFGNSGVRKVGRATCPNGEVRSFATVRGQDAPQNCLFMGWVGANSHNCEAYVFFSVPPLTDDFCDWEIASDTP